jgi:hypothetical protein
MILLSDVFAEIERQLAWRGPAGKGQGHIVLDRECAEVLLEQMTCAHGFKPRRCPVCSMVDGIRKAEEKADEPAAAE